MNILCMLCRFQILVVDDPTKVDQFFGPHSNPDDRYKCPRCEGALVFGAEGEGDVQLDAHDAHISLSGFGLPEERECTAEVVRNLFKSKVLTVDAINIPNTARCVIKSFTFEDGSVLHISSGGYGPTAHKLRRPRVQEDSSVLQETEG